MTDKDPKGMTASELLRATAFEIEKMNYLATSEGVDKFRSALGVKESPVNYNVDLANTISAVADKIDAELAQARELSLSAGAELWAKANGWPDFKEGEGFGAWIGRCAIPRPRFEDGEPVQFGELVGSNLFGAVKVSAIEFTEDGTYVKDEPDGDWSTSLEVTTNRLQRPAPEVLGADGLPIKVGETVWLEKDGCEGTVKGLGVNGSSTAYIEWEDGRWSPNVMCDHLTHTPPDTQERIDQDAAKDYDDYWDCEGRECDECPAEIDGKSPSQRYGVIECDKAMVCDLLRRQRELDKRTGGAE